MIQSWEKCNIYNSTSRRVSVGAWRYPNEGIIELDYYNYDTGRIGPYKFVETYGYVIENYAKYATPSVSLLYKSLVLNLSAIAAFFVNNIVVCTVFEDRLEYVIIGDDLIDNTVQTDVTMDIPELWDIGYVRTKPACISVPTYPYRLKCDINNFKVYLGKGVWMDLGEGSLPDPRVCNDFALYKELVETKYNAVWKDLTTGNLVFI